ETDIEIDLVAPRLALRLDRQGVPDDARRLRIVEPRVDRHRPRRDPYRTLHPRQPRLPLQQVSRRTPISTPKPPSLFAAPTSGRGLSRRSSGDAGWGGGPRSGGRKAPSPASRTREHCAQMEPSRERQCERVPRGPAPPAALPPSPPGATKLLVP